MRFFNLNFNNVVNIGTGIGVTVNEILKVIRTYISYGGNIIYSEAIPSDVPEIVLDIKRLKGLIKYDFISLNEGIQRTLENILQHNS